MPPSSTHTCTRWRFDIRIKASDPEPDDIITVEAAINRTASVSFELTNQFPTYAPYRAYFTMDSAPDFSVHPEEGVLPPAGGQGSSFVIGFTPREYGKMLFGKLIVEVRVSTIVRPGWFTLCTHRLHVVCWLRSRHFLCQTQQPVSTAHVLMYAPFLCALLLSDCGNDVVVRGAWDTSRV